MRSHDDRLDHRSAVASSDRTLQSRGRVVHRIVAVTVGVYLLQLLTLRNGGSLVSDWLAIERDLVLRYGHVWRLVTYAFCHSEHTLTHITFNMIALYFLGRVVARTIGDREFLWFYLTGAAFSGIVQLCAMAVFPTDGVNWVLGASGAISAAFMVFAMYYPRMKLYFFGILPVEARWLLAFAVMVDSLGFLGLAPSVFVPSGANVGHAAHLGGLMFGFLYFRWNMNLTRWWDQFAGRMKSTPLQSRTNLRVFNPGTQPEADLSERVDDILARISVHGEAGLSERERRILNQASEQLRGSRS
ncbi:MAG: rhomboid family intramembrane serine protease [Planctomycetaceae bacterium]|nr:rhomboid family intramembrane serine protease [Planctomycetaceae bacterium]